MSLNVFYKDKHTLVVVGNPDTIRGRGSRIVCSMGEFQLYNESGELVATSTHGKRLGQWAIDDALGWSVTYDYDLNIDHGR